MLEKGCLDCVTSWDAKGHLSLTYRLELLLQDRCKYFKVGGGKKYKILYIYKFLIK